MRHFQDRLTTEVRQQSLINDGGSNNDSVRETARLCGSRPAELQEASLCCCCGRGNWTIPNFHSPSRNPSRQPKLTVAGEKFSLSNISSINTSHVATKNRFALCYAVVNRLWTHCTALPLHSYAECTPHEEHEYIFYSELHNITFYD